MWEREANEPGAIFLQTNGTLKYLWHSLATNSTNSISCQFESGAKSEEPHLQVSLVETRLFSFAFKGGSRALSPERQRRRRAQFTFSHTNTHTALCLGWKFLCVLTSSAFENFRSLHLVKTRLVPFRLLPLFLPLCEVLCKTSLDTNSLSLYVPRAS